MSTQTFTGYRFFTIREEHISDEGWEITVSDPLDGIIAHFVGPTRKEVLAALRAAGYVKVRDNR